MYIADIIRKIHLNVHYLSKELLPFLPTKISIFSAVQTIIQSIRTEEYNPSQYLSSISNKYMEV